MIALVLIWLGVAAVLGVVLHRELTTWGPTRRIAAHMAKGMLEELAALIDEAFDEELIYGEGAGRPQGIAQHEARISDYRAGWEITLHVEAAKGEPCPTCGGPIDGTLALTADDGPAVLRFYCVPCAPPIMKPEQPPGSLSLG